MKRVAGLKYLLATSMKLQTKKFLNLLKADTTVLANNTAAAVVALNAHMVKTSHWLLSDKNQFSEQVSLLCSGESFHISPRKMDAGILKRGKTAICSPLTMIVNVSPNIHQALFTYIHYSSMGYEAKLG